MTLVEVVARMGVRSRRIRRIGWQSGAGPGNQHWHVWTVDAERYVLRRHAEFHTRPGIEYEAALLAHLAGAGWTVPKRIGATIEVAGQLYSLYAYVPGRRLADSPVRSRERGALLARLHTDAMVLVGNGQRPGYGFLHDLEPIRARENWTEKLTALTDGELAEQIRAANEVVEEQLRQVPIERLPRTVIHCDFQPHNVHYLNGTFSGLVDFDLAHLDLRAADLAVAGNAELIGSYCATADPPVSAAERSAISVLRNALHVQQLAFLLGADRCTRSAVQRHLDHITT